MRFYLGVHQPAWLGRLDVPLFVSRRRLAGRRSLPRALGPWALDSGGFSELRLFGRWTVSPVGYVREIRRYAGEIGQLAWAAPMDWMCEPFMIARTGLTLAAHQWRTVTNFLQLRCLAPDLPVIPVLQGWEPADYLRCADMYAGVGVDLTAEPLVGLGSVCRRQATGAVAAVAGTLSAWGLRLHGFGVKTAGLRNCAADLVSADSLAWSFGGRRVPGCAPGHATEANCMRYAMAWRARAIAKAGGDTQLALPLPADSYSSKTDTIPRWQSTTPARTRGRAVHRTNLART